MIKDLVKHELRLLRAALRRAEEHCDKLDVAIAEEEAREGLPVVIVVQPDCGYDEGPLDPAGPNYSGLEE